MKFSYNPGDKLYRKHLHEKYGGSNQGGICPTRSGYIFLFSDPKIGSEFGYRDGWKDDCYMYFDQHIEFSYKENNLEIHVLQNIDKENKRLRQRSEGREAQRK